MKGSMSTDLGIITVDLDVIEIGRASCRERV